MIRRANPDDFLEILGFAEMMFSNAVFECDRELAAREVFNTILESNVFVAVNNGQIVGTAGFEVVQPAWYSKDQALVDRWISVREEKRGGYLAGKLILSLEKEAERLGVPFMPMVAGSQKYAPTFEGRYGKPVAVLFRKDH